MDKLLNPDIGLMIWTIATFAVLVFVLGKFAWKPLISALDERENKIRADIKAAEDAKVSAEAARAEYDKQMARLDEKSRQILVQTQKEAETLKDGILKQSQAESAKLLERTRQQLVEEQRQLIGQMRSEMANLTVRATEKVLRKSIDKKMQESVMDEALSEFDKAAK
jgi:F-type H+-transporting ATPase subunit b